MFLALRELVFARGRMLLLGSNIVNGAVQDGTQIDLTLFGVESDSFLAPEPSSGEAIGRPDGIVVSETLQREGVEIGDVFTLDRSDVELTVIGFTGARRPSATWTSGTCRWTPGGC